MKTIKTVIGANYGDEGKGLLTRYFCLKEKNPIVIFYNGSSNRGSAIDFKQVNNSIKVNAIGAGTVDGIPTYYSKYFAISLNDIYRNLYNINVKLYIDKECEIITPFDKLVDNIIFLDKKYKGEKYNSCCAGNNSLYYRKQNGITLIYNDLLEKDNRQLIENIYYNWFCQIKEKLDIKFIDKQYQKLFDNIDNCKDIINEFINDINKAKEKLMVSTFKNIYKTYNTLIFEGGNGLAISEFTKNGTKSNPGIANVIELLKDFDDYQAEACYVTRSYTTRHGIGNYPEEDKNIYFTDMFNSCNLGQGALRFGKLDYNLFIERIENDFDQADSHWIKTTAITHLNELNLKIKDKFRYNSYTKFAEDIIDRGTYD